LRNNRVAEGAQLSQTSGKPINQQLCSGFKSPPFAGLERIPEIRRATNWTLTVAWVPSGRIPVMLTSAPGCDMLSVTAASARDVIERIMDDRSSAERREHYVRTLGAVRGWRERSAEQTARNRERSREYQRAKSARRKAESITAP
jgi:hypothetical protein